MGREASARQASAPRRSSGNRFRGSFRRRKSKQTRLNLAGEAGGANKKRRTGDDSSYALSLPIPSHPPCFRLDLFACPSLFHHRTTPYCSRCSRPIIHPGATTGYPILARVAAVPRLASCHPSISVIIFMLSAPQPSSPPHAFQYFTVALLRLSPSFPTLFNFQDNQAIPPGYTRNFKPRRITCFHSAELFGLHRLVPCFPFPFSLPPSLFLPCNAIVRRSSDQQHANRPRNFIPRYFHDSPPCF